MFQGWSSVKNSTEHGSTTTSRLAVAEPGKVCLRQSWSAMVGRGRSWTARRSCARRRGRPARPGRFWPSDEIRQHFRKVDISRDFGFSASEIFWVLWLAEKLCEPPNLVAPRTVSRVQRSVSKGSVGSIEQSCKSDEIRQHCITCHIGGPKLTYRVTRRPNM